MIIAACLLHARPGSNTFIHTAHILTQQSILLILAGPLRVCVCVCLSVCLSVSELLLDSLTVYFFLMESGDFIGFGS